MQFPPSHRRCDAFTFLFYFFFCCFSCCLWFLQAFYKLQASGHSTSQLTEIQLALKNKYISKNNQMPCSNLPISIVNRAFPFSFYQFFSKFSFFPLFLGSDGSCCVLFHILQPGILSYNSDERGG